MTRYNLRVDSNQSAIVKVLLDAGAQVDIIGKPVDLLVGWPGTKHFAFFECKDGDKVKSAQKPTPAQVKFFERWAGYPLFIVDSPETALAMLQVLIKP